MSGQPPKVAVVTGAGSSIGAAVVRAWPPRGGRWCWPAGGVTPWRRSPGGAPGWPACSIRSWPDVTGEASRCRPCSTPSSSSRVDLLFKRLLAPAPGPRPGRRVPGRVERRGGGELTRSAPLHPGGVPGHAPSAARWRPDRQQRLHLGAPTRRSGPTPRPSTRSHGADKGDHAGRARPRHRLWADRHRQRRHRPDRGHAGRRAPCRRQRAAQARIDVADVARAVCYIASLPLDTNIATMTVMATRCRSSAPARLAGHHLLGPARRGRLLGCRRFGYGADVKRTGHEGPDRWRRPWRPLTRSRWRMPGDFDGVVAAVTSGGSGTTSGG